MIGFWVIVALVALGVGGYLAAPYLKRRAFVPAAIAGAPAPAIALIAYFVVGAPNLAGISPAALVDEERQRADSMIAMIEERVAEAPDDAAAWRRLVAAQLAVQDYPGAATSFRRLIELAPDDASLQSALGESLVLSRGGVVSEEARAAFEAAQAGDPDDVRSAFYLAEAKYQAGQPDEAMADWGALAVRGTPNAPWLATVAARLLRASQMQERSMDSLGLPAETMAALDVALGRASAPVRGPTDEDVAKAAEMTPEQRAAMIEGMVGSLAARLEQNPDDVEGWRMLARSYRQLGRDEESVEALRQVRRLVPEDLEGLRDFAYGLWLAGADDGPPSAETIVALEELLARDEHDPVAMLGLAEAARAAGDEPRVTALLTRLAADETAPPVLRAEARRQLEAAPEEPPSAEP